MSHVVVERPLSLTPMTGLRRPGRPLRIVSTVSKAGVNNVASYSYISPAATTPTSFVLSVLRRDDGSEKDTLINLRASGELVINAVTEAIVGAANACAENVPPHKSEFELTGLTLAFLSSRAPHVAQSPLRFECKVETEIPFGDDCRGASLDRQKQRRSVPRRGWSVHHRSAQYGRGTGCSGFYYLLIG